MAKRRKKRPPRKWVPRVAALIVLLAPFVWGFLIEPHLTVTRYTDLPVPRWPKKLDGVRIAALADLHVGAPHMSLARLRDVVGRTNEARPDVIVLLGDYVIHGVVGGSFVDPETFGPVLGGLHARLGVYAVLGNHDYWFDEQRVRKALSAAGIRVLENDAVEIKDRTTSYWLAGVGDLWNGRTDIEAALRKVDNDSPVILAMHNPDVFPKMPERVNLTLAGHTHGGQVWLPWFGRLKVPSEFGQRYAAGHVVEGGRHMFVTTGVGTSIIPVRFGVVPEVAVLNLRPADPKGR